MDSAPELWLTTPVAGDAVEGPAGGRVVHRLACGVGTEEPRRHDPGEAGRGPASRAASAVASSDWSRESAPYAIWERRSGSGSRPLSGPPEVSSHGSNVNESRCAAAASAGSPEHGRGVGQRGRASAHPRRATASGTPPRGGPRPSASCGRHRRPAPRCPRLSWDRTLRAVARATRRDVRREAEDGLGGGVRAVGDQPRRRRLAVDVQVLAVLVEDLPVDRADRQLEPVAEEARERGVGLLEGRVALAERPDRAGQPVGRVAVGRVGQLHRLGAAGSGCRRAASTAPRCRRSARSRSAGRSGRAASRTPRPGWPSTRWPASAAGRRPRRGSRRRR